MDIGPQSSRNFAAVISAAKTVIWNGPAGVFEKDIFANGTKALLDAVCSATKAGAVTIIGKFIYIFNVRLLGMYL